MYGKRRHTRLWVAASVVAVALAPAVAGAAAPFTLRSPDIAPGASIGPSHVYDHSGCSGGNLSPAFSWSRPPAGTRSFALLVLDTDAPLGNFWHWMVFDIPATTRSLRAGAGDPARDLLPRGAIQTRNGYGFPGYGGPCPPSGSLHHYHFMLYALRVPRLGLGAGAQPDQVSSTVTAEALGEAEIVATYSQ